MLIVMQCQGLEARGEGVGVERGGGFNQAKYSPLNLIQGSY